MEPLTGGLKLFYARPINHLTVLLLLLLLLLSPSLVPLFYITFKISNVSHIIYLVNL